MFEAGQAIKVVHILGRPLLIGALIGRKGQYSPLFEPAVPFFNVDVDVCLLVEPIIVRLPLLVRVCEADMKQPNDLRDQFIDFAQRDLQNMLA